METLHKNIICNRLKELRILHNLTQKEVADKINVERSTYSCYELGKTVPHINTLLALSKIYNVPLDYLIGEM